MIQSPEPSISEMPPEILNKIKIAFKTFDTKGKGTINPTEIKKAMESLGESERNATAYQLISLLNEDKNDEVTFDEFVKAIYQKLGDNKTQAGIKRLFNMFKNRPESNVITFDDLKNISEQLGENISEEDLEEMMNRISKGQGQLTFQQFYNIISEK